MEIVRFKIDDEVFTELHRTFFERSAAANIIQSLIETHQFDEDDSVLNSVVYKAYDKKYIDAVAANELIKDAITTAYIPEQYRSSKYTWVADFATQEIVINTI